MHTKYSRENIISWVVTMSNIIKYSYTSIVLSMLLMCVCFPSNFCNAQYIKKPHLFLETYGPYIERGVFCKNVLPKCTENIPSREQQSYFAGSMLRLAVRIDVPNQKDEEIISGNPNQWPDGLHIWAGNLDGSGNFIPSSELTDQLQFEYVMHYDKTVYVFQFIIPPQFAASSLRIGARYDHPLLGRIEASGFPIIEVVQPKTNEDHYLIWDHMIGYIRETQNDYRIVYLVDSLMYKGYRSRAGLSNTQASAERLQQWQRTLNYFETNYQTNGRAALPFVTDDMSKEQVEEEYKNTRTRIMNHQPETRHKPVTAIY
jgi:hypothetical protein